MPRNDKTGVVQRQWALIQCLKETYQTTQDVHRALQNSHDIHVDENTVLRDLKALRESGFSIESSDSKPLNWRLGKAFATRLGAMSEAEALMVVLADEHLRRALPVNNLSVGLRAVADQARRQLDARRRPGLTGHKSVQWLDKVRVVPATQPQIPPEVDPGIQRTLMAAMLDECPVRVRYKGIDMACLTPLALVVRGGVLYLAATRDAEPEIKRFALHRFESAEMVPLKAFNRPDGFNIDALLRGGWADFQSEGDGDIRLELWCRLALKDHLWEMPLSEKQWITPQAVAEGWYMVTVTLPCTWQLRMWLLSQGENVQVREPGWLRDEMRGTLEKALGVYRES